MKCERACEWMLEYSDGRLAPPLAQEVRIHVEGCANCQAELKQVQKMLHLLDAAPAPRLSPNLRRKVFAAIEAERVASRYAPAPRIRRSWLPALQACAACGLIAIGYFAGSRRAPDPATQQQLTELRGKVDSMAQAVGYTLQQDQTRSTAQRLEGVLAAKLVRTPDQGVIDKLIGTLALDPSANVRLGAVEALYPHADDEVVRTSLLVSLPREQSPLVQLAMIDFLAATKDRDAGPVLEKLSTSETVDPNVREAAKRAITRL